MPLQQIKSLCIPCDQNSWLKSKTKKRENGEIQKSIAIVVIVNNYDKQKM
jgi:hypothetical protein